MQVQRINVSTPLVLPSFDFKVTSFQKVEVSGEEIQVCRCGSKKYFQSHEVKMIMLKDEQIRLSKWLDKN